MAPSYSPSAFSGGRLETRINLRETPSLLAPRLRGDGELSVALRSVEQRLTATLSANRRRWPPAARDQPENPHDSDRTKDCDKNGPDQTALRGQSEQAHNPSADHRSDDPEHVIDTRLSPFDFASCSIEQVRDAETFSPSE